MPNALRLGGDRDAVPPHDVTVVQPLHQDVRLVSHRLAVLFHLEDVRRVMEVAPLLGDDAAVVRDPLGAGPLARGDLDPVLADRPRWLSPSSHRSYLTSRLFPSRFVVALTP